MSKFVAVLILSVGTGLVVGKCDVPPPPCNNCSDERVSAGEDTLSQGSLLLWTCDPGYVMTGDGDTVVWVCGQNDTWLGPDPNCTEVSCSDPPIPANGSISGGRQHRYPQGTNVSYVCDSGYSLTFTNSSAYVTCGSNGEWTFSGAYCKIDCPENYIEHNNVCFKDFPSENRHGYAWTAARQECKNNEEILALSKDNSTHAFLKNMTGNDNYWIGARQGRNWKWASNGSNIQRLFWNEGEPNGRRERCVALFRNHNEREFFWYDEECKKRHGFICQSGEQVVFGRIF
ncbi:zona pellucida sperm-binding protein 3 receptor-like [Diadema antillarum]|uniref:zona pellucida sperm-binding protein 3 receptor-like n=1 Tax=Diadema antillarum TaxID=105358 RepID=UPI003A89C22A